MKRVSKKIICAFSGLILSAACAFAYGNNGEQILNSVLKGKSIYSIPLSTALVGEQAFLDVASANAAVDPKDPYRVVYDHKSPEGDPVQFKEIWAYLLDGNFSDYKEGMTITDLCIFSADINSYGELNYIPDVSKVKGFKGRKHLVVTSQSRSLTHFVLDPSFGIREKIIKVLVDACDHKGYDGIQVDFEIIPQRDADNFITFLADIREAIGQERWFSVAVPARTKTLKDDIFNYKKIAANCDRVIIMAYDEHWSGGKPGPVASTDWCHNVVTYAVSQMPQKKVIMGLPFYGRTWINKNLARAWFFSGIMRNINEHDVAAEIKREKGVPYFSYETSVKVTAYFDDTYSLVSKMRMYKEKTVERIAFWCLGQEDPDIWNWVAH